ncbi:hypothetical protein [uncultured Paracoccus sp.]|nr:hypothetical protein [uncultured Paracoccus sp.]
MSLADQAHQIVFRDEKATANWEQDKNMVGLTFPPHPKAAIA